MNIEADIQRQADDLQREWETDPRWATIRRDHTAEQRAFEALLRITDLYAVPVATNPSTADILVRHIDSE